MVGSSPSETAWFHELDRSRGVQLAVQRLDVGARPYLGTLQALPVIRHREVRREQWSTRDSAGGSGSMDASARARASSVASRPLRPGAPSSVRRWTGLLQPPSRLAPPRTLPREQQAGAFAIHVAEVPRSLFEQLLHVGDPRASASPSRAFSRSRARRAGILLGAGSRRFVEGARRAASSANSSASSQRPPSPTNNDSSPSAAMSTPFRSTRPPQTRGARSPRRRRRLPSTTLATRAAGSRSFAKARCRSLGSTRGVRLAASGDSLPGQHGAQRGDRRRDEVCAHRVAGNRRRGCSKPASRPRAVVASPV